MSAFGKSLRRRVIARNNTSERLVSAYRPRRWRWYKMSAVPFMLPIVSLWPAFVLMVLVLGPIGAEAWDGKPGGRTSAVLGLAAHAHFVSGVVALALAVGGRATFCEGLIWLAYFPHPDTEGVRRSNRTWLGYLLVACASSYFVFRTVGIHQDVPLARSLLLIPLAALHAATVYATAVVAVALFRPTAKLALAMDNWAGISLFGYAACMLSMVWPPSLPPLLAAYLPWPAQPPAWLESLATFSGLLLPTGWVDAVVWYGVVRGEAWGWLFLLPCAALSALAFWCRPRLVSLREIRVSSQGQLEAVFADDPEPEAVAEQARVAAAGGARPQPTTEAAPSLPTATDRQAVLKRLLSGPPLAKTDWSAGWPLERLLGRLLSERERVLTSDGDDAQCVTVSWLVATTAATAATTLVLLVWLFSNNAEVCVGLAAALSPLVCVLVAARWSVKSRSSYGAVINHPQFPLGFRETGVLAMKLGLFNLLVSVPIVAASLTVVTACVPLSKDATLAPIIGTAAGVVAICLVAPAFGFARHICYEFSVHRLAYLFMLGGLLIAAYAMLMLAFVKPHWPATLVLGMIVLAWAATQRMYFDWLYHSGRLDYVDWRPPREEKR